jgi:hypothetical protein
VRAPPSPPAKLNPYQRRGLPHRYAAYGPLKERRDPVGAIRASLLSQWPTCQENVLKQFRDYAHNGHQVTAMTETSRARSGCAFRPIASHSEIAADSSDGSDPFDPAHRATEPALMNTSSCAIRVIISMPRGSLLCDSSQASVQHCRLFGCIPCSRCAPHVPGMISTLR